MCIRDIALFNINTFTPNVWFGIVEVVVVELYLQCFLRMKNFQNILKDYLKACDT